MQRLKRLLPLLEHAIVGYYAWNVIRRIFKIGPKAFVEKFAISVLKQIPGGAAILAGEAAKSVEAIKQHVDIDLGEHDVFGVQREIPEKGMELSLLMDGIKKLRGAETDYRSGKAFGGIYCDDKELKVAANEAYCYFTDSNALYPGIFPALRKFELETIRMVITMMHGTQEQVGCMTSGGTESILMAVHAYKNRAVSRGVEYPEALICVTAHAAFAKACEYFSVKFVPIKAKSDFRMDVDDVKSKMNSNVCLIVGSAPQFAQGVIDPIEELSEIALKHDIGLHVDACLGGFLLPWYEKLGKLKVKFPDFRVPGVTSISADIHKFGFSAKGASVILYRNKEWRRHMFFSYTEWTGGMYASPTMLGSRAGGVIASAWATLMALGQDGYMDIAANCYETFRGVVDGVNAIDGLEICGEPDGATASFRCTSGSDNKIYQVACALKDLDGYVINYMNNPTACQVQLGKRKGFVASEFCAALERALRAVEADPEKYSGGLAQIYGMAANLGDRETVGSILLDYLDAVYTDSPPAIESSK